MDSPFELALRLALVLWPQLCFIALLIAAAVRSGGSYRIMLWASVGCSLVSLVLDAIAHLMLGSQQLSAVAWVGAIAGVFHLAAWTLALLVIILARPGARNGAPYIPFGR